MSAFDSTDDARTSNNTVRHQYRTLTDAEKQAVSSIKSMGSEFLALIDSVRTPPEHDGYSDMAVVTIDRELNIAAERIEEAVMWAVKHITK